MREPRNGKPIGAFVLLVCLSSVAAQGPRSDEPRKLELDQPYQLNVVLDVAKHALLTPVFKEQVKRELQDGLRAAFGDMARVAVIDKHPKLDQVRRDGLQSVLDGWNTLAAEKTHFVLIDYTDGQYEVQARQHDGLTGQASPTVRRGRLSDRQFVARLATFLVVRDFGLVGKVTAGKAPKTAEVSFKGAALGGPLSRWVSKGDVLQIVSVAGGASARKAEYALLVIDEMDENGTCKCRVFDRYGSAMRGTDLRCLRLHTIKAPLRVELLQEGTGGGRVPNLGVTLRKHGFEGEEGTKMERSFDIEGFLDTEKDKGSGVFDRIAFLTVKVEPKAAIVPVAIVDERPIKVKVNARPLEASDLVRIKKELWEREIYDHGLIMQELFRELKEWEKNPSLRAKAMGRAKEGLEQAREARKQLGGERDDLLKEAQKGGQTLDMGFGDGWMRYLDGGVTRLETYLAAQDKILKEENDPKKIAFKTLVQQAKREEGAAEFDKALELYEQALKTGFDDGTVKQDYDKLKARWTPKNEEHRKARLYLETEWPALDLLTSAGAADEAAKAFQVLSKERDVLGAVKLRQAILGQSGKLKAKKDSLEPDINEEDRQIVKQIADLAAQLRKLALDVEAFIKQGK